MKHVKLRSVVVCDDENEQALWLCFSDDLAYVSISNTKDDGHIIQETDFRLTAEEAIRLAETILNRYKVVS